MQPNQQYAANLYGQPPQQGYPQPLQQYPQQQYPPQPAAGVMPTAPPQFAAPQAVGSGVRLKPEDCSGHLLAVCPITVLPGFFPGKDASKPPSDAIRCDVIDLDANGGQGATYNGILWGQKVLCESLSRQIGEVVLGRMGRGVAKGGNSAPWILVDASADPEAIQRGQGFFAAHPNWRNEPSTGVEPIQAQAAQAAPGMPWPAGAQQYPPQPPYAPQGPPAQQYGPPQPAYGQPPAQYQPQPAPYGQPAPYPQGPPIPQYDPAAQAMYQQAQQGQQPIQPPF